MRFSIFTHAEHKIYKEKVYSYGPYVKEINLWNSYFDEICVLSPVTEEKPDAIDTVYSHNNLILEQLSSLHFKNKKSFFSSVFNSFTIIRKIIREMRRTDHIHIRCPGNIGLLACLTQILFPTKPKTIKYAGNWASGSGQPKSYRFQKWLISNEYLTRNTKVLVYGNWPGKSKNIISFFTASYSINEKENIKKNFDPPYKFVFAGSMVEGKRPLFAIKLIEKLKENGFEVQLDMYGGGKLENELQNYIFNNNLDDIITLFGNQSAETIKMAYMSAHFSILPSKSEGWPKAIAEAMFFGCVPIATKISCLPWMLGDGKRGILIDPDINSCVEKVSAYLKSSEKLENLSEQAKIWSRRYTLERFEKEIRNLI